ncbi:MAG: peptide MFS transporter [Vicinamibacterales bacterium]
MATASAPQGLGDAASDRAFFGHPGGLSTLFFSEMWERFSYYGMRALLILFMTATVAEGGLGFDTATAGAIYGMYTAMVYMTNLPGGWLADRVFGQRRAVLYGGILIASGHFSMAVPTIPSFYLGLVLIIFGTGLLKPNISVIVGQLYGKDDDRRDAGFSIFYMGINLGAFIAPLVCGYLAQDAGFAARLASWGFDPTHAWHWGFGAAGIGMTLGLIQYVLGARKLGTAGLHPSPAPPDQAAADRRNATIGIVGVVVLLILLAVAASNGAVSLLTIADSAGYLLGAVTIGFFAWLFLGGDWTKEERDRLIVISVFFLAAALFWSVFEQAGSTLNLFADRNTRTVILGYEFPSSWFQSVNSLFIIIFAPVFAWLWVTLGKKQPASPMKFSLGLIGVGLGFLVLVPAARLSADGTLVSPLWLVMTYLLHTWAELCLSPVGLSSMTKLAPARIVSLMMGVWFLGASVGNYIGGRVGGMYESLSLPTLFGVVALFGIAAGILMLLTSRKLTQMMHGVR